MAFFASSIIYVVVVQERRSCGAAASTETQKPADAIASAGLSDPEFSNVSEFLASPFPGFCRNRSESFADTPAEGMMSMAAVSMKLHENNDIRSRGKAPNAVWRCLDRKTANVSWLQSAFGSVDMLGLGTPVVLSEAKDLAFLQRPRGPSLPLRLRSGSVQDDISDFSESMSTEPERLSCCETGAHE